MVFSSTDYDYRIDVWIDLFFLSSMLIILFLRISRNLNQNYCIFYTNDGCKDNFTKNIK